jgi:drug/metabolite transporter (DMT)-like permease
MIYLLFNIICSALLYGIFRYYDKFKVDNLSAIVYNYLTAFVLGFLLSNNPYRIIYGYENQWFYLALIMGAVFISIFLLMAKSSQINGITATSVANKMSLVIPVIFGIILYNESFGIKKVSGIILALCAIMMVSYKKNDHKWLSGNYGWLILIFLGSGAIDTLMKFAEHKLLCTCETTAFIASIFFFAALFGILWKVIYLGTAAELFKFKNICAGILLGIPNYGSIYFLMQALNKSGLESSVLYPYNNLGTIVLSMLLGIILFKERYNLLNYLGIILAMAGVTLISW